MGAGDSFITAFLLEYAAGVKAGLEGEAIYRLSLIHIYRTTALGSDGRYRDVGARSDRTSAFGGDGGRWNIPCGGLGRG